MPLHRLAILVSLSLAACAASPPPVEVREIPVAAANGPTAPAPPTPQSPCAALAEPLHALRRLAGLVSLGRSMAIRPVDSSKLIAALDAHAAAARSVKTDDTELTKLAADTAARLTKIAESARAFQAKHDVDAEPQRISLLEEMERGEIMVQVGEARCKETEGLAGRMTGSAIQRGVRAGMDAFKHCHQAGLRRDPRLAGVVRVRFVIARDGSVREAADADREAPDPIAWGLGASAPSITDAEVSACVIGAFKKLTFGKPAGGTFEGTYPITLESR